MSSTLVWSLVGIVVGILVLVPIGGLACRALLQRRAGKALAVQTHNGIDDGRFVRIGDIEQWIQIRGEDRTNPILLVLHGHGLSMSAFTPLLRSWEQQFTVVQWDRRGVGKTRTRSGTAGSQNWTFERFTDDGIAVTEYVCRHLSQPRVILVGHSEGSAIGLLMLKRRPDLFHAYVGTGQLVDMHHNEALTYQTAIERAQTLPQTKALKALQRIGAPPYPQARTSLVKQRWSASTAPEMDVWQPLVPRLVLSAPRYSLRDAYYALTGVLYLPQPLYEEYMAFDARHLGMTFALPFFLFQGDADVLTPTVLATEYLATVEAPTKGLVLLQDGGHLAVLLQPQQFLQALLTHVRPRVVEAVRSVVR
jgi:pimeloyl-ACP methyl ester carboxylesterase